MVKSIDYFLENVGGSRDRSLSTGLESVQDDLEIGEEPAWDFSQRSHSPNKDDDIDEALEQHLMELEEEEEDSD